MDFANNHIRKDFQILDQYIYLDNASTTQKPYDVIQWVNDFVSHNYANIHRWTYILSEISENLYHESKNLFASLIHAWNHPVVYSYNATFCINQVALSLLYSQYFSQWDVILVGRREHHANIVPWIELAQRNNLLIDYIELDEYGQIDLDDFSSKYSKKVAVISLSLYSNVLWHHISLDWLAKIIEDYTFLLIDGSQFIPHKTIHFSDSRIDCLVATGHKMLAYTWIGVMVFKNKWISRLHPSLFWWWMVSDVSLEAVDYVNDTSKFESWTPNIIGAVSLLYAIRYIKKYDEWKLSTLLRSNR